MNELNPYNATTSVSYGDSVDTVRYKPGDDPRNLIHNRVIDLHGIMLAIWVFYAFGIALTMVVVGSLLGPVIGLIVAGVATAFTVKFVLRKNDKTIGLINQWNLVLSGKPPRDDKPERLGPAIEQID